MQRTVFLQICKAQRASTCVVPSLQQLRLCTWKARESSKQYNTSEKKKGWSFFIRPVLFLGGSALAGAFVVNSGHQEQKPDSKKEVSSVQTTLGGEWTLTDQDGRERKSSDFHGQFVLLYFGLTHCPDVCPVEVEKMCSVVDRVDRFRQSESSSSKSDLYAITPLMVTVDPERDTPDVMKRYCSNFSPKLVGLTGTADEIEEVTRAFRVYYSRKKSTEQNEAEQDYMVDHTIVTYLFGPSGDFVDFYSQHKPPEDMAGSIILHMLNERKKQH